MTRTLVQGTLRRVYDGQYTRIHYVYIYIYIYIYIYMGNLTYCEIFYFNKLLFQHQLYLGLHILLQYSRTRFTRHLVYSVTHSVVQINPSLLAITLYSSVITILIYNDTQQFHEVIAEFDSIYKNVFDT